MPTFTQYSMLAWHPRASIMNDDQARKLRVLTYFAVRTRADRTEKCQQRLEVTLIGVDSYKVHVLWKACCYSITGTS